MENVDEEWIDHDRYVDDRYIPERNVMASFGGTSPSPTYGQRMAARRRRTVLVVLAGTVVVSALGGFVASVLWGLTIIAVIALVLYVGLMSWMATHQGQLWNDSNERHVARGVSEHRSTMADPYSNDDDQGFARDLWDDESDRIPREAHEDDVWWDEPRRAASR